MYLCISAYLCVSVCTCASLRICVSVYALHVRTHVCTYAAIQIRRFTHPEDRIEQTFDYRVGRLSYVFVWVSCFLNMLYDDFASISPDFRHNISLEHLEKGDNHNSAFPQPSMCCFIKVGRAHNRRKQAIGKAWALSNRQLYDRSLTT